MAVSIADSPGYVPSPPCLFLSMPDHKKATPVKQSVWHRSWLPKWLLRDGRHSTSPLRGKHREWNGDCENDDSCTSNSLPQTPLTDAGGAILRNITSNVHASHIAARLHPEHHRTVSADRQTRRDFYRSRSADRLSTSQLSAPEIHRGDNGLSDPCQWFDTSPPPFPDPSDAGAYDESISGNGDDFKDILETELDKKWILNLSLRFRNGSDREKFFVTYVEATNRWRRVTITCDYGRAEPGSLEQDLKEQPYQSEKNARIYESIRDSISQIEFYDTVTNLRLETLHGQLHVNVTEDANEIILYPSISTIRTLESPLIPESQLTFETHFSGFAYQVRYHGKDYVKKEITGPESVDEFLYEINALYELLHARNVIELKGIVVDDTCRVVKGLLLDFASNGDLAGMLQEYEGEIQWKRRERWARQIVHGLAEIHEGGFVQGDLTVTNIVVDRNDDAKIIDINRRGCPIGWEPPEFKQKLENRQRISMYIGVKSDLYQLGMILWAIAMEVDQPERHQRPLLIPDNAQVPDYYRKLVLTCLSERPRNRLSAKELLEIFPQELSLRHPEPEMANKPPENRITGSLYNLDRAASSDRMSRTYPDQFADSSQIVSASDHAAQQNTPHTGYGGPNRRPSTESCSRGGRNPSPDGYVDASSLRRKSQTEGDLVEGVDKAIGVVSTPAVTQPDSTVVSGARPEDSDTLDETSEIQPEEILANIPCTFGPNHPSGRDPSSELLPFLGSHPSCSFESHSMMAKEENWPREQPRSSADTTEGLSRASDDDVFKTAKETQDEETTPGCALDLTSSNLPINPAFKPRIPAEEGAQNQHEPTVIPQYNGRKDKTRVRKLRRVSSQTGLNDLFASYLPINPGLKEQAQRRSECLSKEYISFVSSNTPTKAPSPSSSAPRRKEDLSDDAKLHDKCIQSEPAPLFTSALPINPALPITMLDFNSEKLPSDTVLNYEAEPVYTPELPVDKARHPTRKNEPFPMLAATLSRCDLLLKSRLPINPAMAWK